MYDSWLVDYVWLVPALPLLSALVTAALGPKVLRERSHWPCVIAAVAAALFSILLLAVVAGAKATDHAVGGDDGKQVNGHGEVAARAVTVYAWIKWDDFPAFPTPIRFRVDPLTSLMLVMVTFVGSLIVIYASGYMHGDRGYWRFFAAVSLFLFAMTGLVLASSFLLIYVFWELVGLCSYLLIGFWYEKPSAAAASKKAFLVNRIGDFGFALGVFLVWATFRGITPEGGMTALDYDHVFKHAGRVAAESPELVTTICLLLFCGAVGKSAQFPLHVWLPDAMEGPTPVSALIHAATMVTAGVYMVARFAPLFLLSPFASLTVSAVGCLTALLAALIALTQTDLKRILAYSTVSQLGFMFMALGCVSAGAVVAGIFHVFTHAFFKALLFLGAGSVMHAMGGVIDVRRFSGLRRRLPITCWTFACGAAALAGFPLLSGFWSKDAILAALEHATHNSHYSFAYAVILGLAMVTACLTAFYTFRAFFKTFWGDEKIPEEAGHHAHESPAVMTYPLIVLAIFAVGIGLVLAKGFDGLAGFLGRTPGLSGAHAPHSMAVMVASSVVAVLGIAVAWVMYGRPSALADSFAARLHAAYELSYGKFKFDELYDRFVVRPLLGIAEVSRVADIWIVDGLVRLASAVPAFFARIALRPIQNGLVQYYALTMVCCLAVLLTAILWMGL